MPELPEVEIVTRRLRDLVKGRFFLKAKLIHPGIARDNSPRQFAAWLKGSQIIEVTRRGKNILTHLSNHRTLVTHLRMTGRFFLLDVDAANTRHTHAIFWLDDGKKLLFDDQRRFGMMAVVRTDELPRLKYLSKLAPEPFSEEFSADYLFQTLKRSSQPIKLALLDQTKVVGLGNIYAAEALHRAKINPRLPANKVAKMRLLDLHREIIAVLAEAIANDNKLAGDAASLESSYGRYEAIAKVYEREKLPCLTCHTPIRRILQGARSTYFCPTCQRR
jgi:formamidopyrimidine-DNA glycosylase